MHPSKLLVPDCLPEELLREILYRLPVKSVLRCMCVCKSWLSFITSPTFVSTHVGRSVSYAKGRQPLFLLRHWSGVGERYSLHLNDQSFTCYRRLPLPPLRPMRIMFHIIGSCNGLVCLADVPDVQIDIVNFFLWNPSIGKLVALPLPISISYASVGFGFDSCTSDYKVVRALVMRAKTAATPLKLEVFSLNSGSWKSLPNFKPEFEILDLSSPVFANRRLHWLAVCFEGLSFRRVLLFDLCDEFVCDIPIPEDLSKKDKDLSLMAWGDSSVAMLQELGSFPKYRIWVLKEYSMEPASRWTKVGVTLPHEHVPADCWQQLLGFKNSREVIVVQKRGKIVSVDLISGEIKQLGLRDNSISFCFLGSYMESLALLDKQNSTPGDASDSDDGATAIKRRRIS